MCCRQHGCPTSGYLNSGQRSCTHPNERPCRNLGHITTTVDRRLWLVRECHYSQLTADANGRVSMTDVVQVFFDYETPGQDGYDARVLTFAEPIKSG